MPEGWEAKWIWVKNHDDALRNIYVYARKNFEVPFDVETAELKITADARYVLFINGRRIGNGPIRGWQHSWFYDVYDVKPYLNAGLINTISIIVWQPGETNFQYPLGRGGLLAQLDLKTRSGRKITIVTDRDWKVCISTAYDQHTPRISCQQGFVEHYDASMDPDWKHPGFDDSYWQNAIELTDDSEKPWGNLVKRPIPFLTSEPVYPVRVLRTRVVTPPRVVYSFDLRPSLIPTDRLSNIQEIIGLAIIVVKTSEAKEVKVTGVNGIGLGSRHVRVNGVDMPVEGNTALLKLRKGENLVVFDVTGSYHDWWFTTIWDGEDLEFENPLGKASAPWAIAGPFQSRNEDGFKTVWDASTVDDIVKASFVQPVASENFASDHVFARIVFAKEVKEGLFSEGIGNLCLPNDEVATIWPSYEGDAELLIDFGRELVGFIDFEIDAPKGVTLDFYGFEAMHPREDYGLDIQHTFGLNNVMRYIAKEGWQSYTSVVRRGFRYLILTIRFPKGETRPVRIRFVRCLFNTYPFEEAGEFVCNDWKLNNIWRMCRYTLRLCSEDTYVDCPAYEQTFWVGDARHEALITYATSGGYALARRCWLLAGESLFRSPLVESQVPSGWQNVLTAWSLLWVWACEEYYRYTGDEAFLKEVYPFVLKQMRNIAERFIRNDGLMEIEAWNMLDWAPMDTPSRGVVTHQNAILVEAYRRSAVIARKMGFESDAKEFEMLAEKVKRAINQHLWDDQRKAYFDAIHHGDTRSKVFSLQTHTMVYLCDVAEDDRKNMLRKYIYEWPEDFVRFGSPFALAFLIEAYAKDGEVQKALDIIRREWGAMLDYGATTTWETLSPRTRSHCHAWSAMPAFFLSSFILGVRPRGVITNGVTIAPEPVDLTWARGSFPTPKGTVNIRWRRDEKSFTLCVELPSCLEGEAVMPSLIPPTAEISVRAGNEFLKASFENGRWRVELPAGVKACIKAIW
ncbi:MAG: family 78 glycoside hydrolase catalytic domain [Candidatus Brockarchaeota archaeon]|nr:family 78 glycoside hydrolase catalytic domain [Candidatus Brockarchaeota archaeon]